MDRGRKVQTLEGYGAGHRICKLMEMFWDQQELASGQNGYHGPALPATRGKT